MPAKPDLPNLRLLPPAEIPAVPGREVNLYFDNVILYPRADLLLYDVDCPRGSQQQERWTWTPKADDPKDVGSFPLTLRITDLAGNPLAEGTTTIHVYPADAGAGKTLSALIVGDSLTNASVYPDEIYNLMQGESNPQFTMLGSVVPNKDKPGVKHEGYGGWTARGFATMWGPEPINAQGRRARSPFLFEQDGKGVLDFQKYCDEQNGGKGPDIITILLGCNDTFNARPDNLEASVGSFLTHLDTLVTEFRRVRADTKIALISLLPPAASQDASGRVVGCGQTRWQYRRNVQRVIERTMAQYGGREAEHLFVVPAYVNLDCVHNYPVTEGPANARASGPGATLIRQNNDVHPAASGYRQLADSLYCWMKAVLATQP